MDANILVIDANVDRRKVTVEQITNAGIHCQELDGYEDLACDYQSLSAECVVLECEANPHDGQPNTLERVASRIQLRPTIVTCQSANADIAVTAFRQGAIDFLRRPFSAGDLLNAIRTGVVAYRRSVEIRDARLRFDGITEPENRLIHLILDGESNRRVAARLDIGLRTVERMRNRLLKKTESQSWLEMIKYYLIAKRTPPWIAPARTTPAEVIYSPLQPFAPGSANSTIGFGS